jgi:hypothetical protein
VIGIQPIASPEAYFEKYPTDDLSERAYVEEVFERHPSLRNDRGLGMLAHNPALADHVMNFVDHLLSDVAWVRRREAWLALLVCERRLGPVGSFVAHVEMALSGQAISGEPQLGLSGPQVSSLAFPDSQVVFNDEERMVIELTEAMFAGHGHVSDELFEAARETYGDKEMVEYVVAASYWLALPYFLAALRAEAPVGDETKTSMGG